MKSAESDRARAPRLLIGSYFPRQVGLEGVGTFIAGLAQGMSAQGWDVSLVLPAGSRRNLRETSCCQTIMTYTPGIRAVRTYGQLMRRESANYDRVLLIENNPNSLAVISRLGGIDLTANKFFSYLYTPLLALKTMGDLRWRRQAWLHVGAKWCHWARLARWRRTRIVVASTYQQQQLKKLGARHVAVVRASVVSKMSERSTNKHVAKKKKTQAPIERNGPASDRCLTIGYLGHFSPAKGVDCLIDAFSVARRHAPMRLLIAHSGKGRLRPPYQALLQKRIADHSIQMAMVVDPVPFLSECDVTVLPYPSSSIHHPPLVLIESMAAGTPVLTTSVGGLPEIIDDGTTGVLVSPGNGAQLAEKLIWLAEHPEQTMNLGINARRKFEKSLCREVCCQQMASVLKGEALEG